MKLFKCSTCDKILEEKFIDKHPASAITWLDATEHEEKKKKVEEIEGANEEEIEEEREKHLESIRKSLRKLSSQELDEELIRLSEELKEIKKKLTPTKEDEEKQERESRLEHIGLDSSLITNTRYHVLTLNQSYRDSKSGDELLILMGSSDSDSVSDTSGDELLKKLGSVD